MLDKVIPVCRYASHCRYEALSCSEVSIVTLTYLPQVLMCSLEASSSFSRMVRGSEVSIVTLTYLPQVLMCSLELHPRLAGWSEVLGSGFSPRNHSPSLCGLSYCCHLAIAEIFNIHCYHLTENKYNQSLFQF